MFSGDFLGTLMEPKNEGVIFYSGERVDTHAHRATITHRGMMGFVRTVVGGSDDETSSSDTILNYAENAGGRFRTQRGMIGRVDGRILHYIDGRAENPYAAAEDLVEYVYDLGVSNTKMKYFEEPSTFFGYISSGENQILFQAQSNSSARVHLEQELARLSIEMHESQFARLLKNEWNGKAVDLTRDLDFGDDVIGFIDYVNAFSHQGIVYKQHPKGASYVELCGDVKGRIAYVATDLSVDPRDPKNQSLEWLTTQEEVPVINGTMGIMGDSLYRLVTDSPHETVESMWGDEIQMNHGISENKVFKYFRDDNEMFGYMHSGRDRTLFRSRFMTDERFDELLTVLDNLKVDTKSFGFARVLKSVFTQ